MSRVPADALGAASDDDDSSLHEIPSFKLNRERSEPRLQLQYGKASILKTPSIFSSLQAAGFNGLCVNDSDIAPSAKASRAEFTYHRDRRVNAHRQVPS